MIPDDHQICAATDHRHWNYGIHWCPHRQQWLVSRSAWLETGTASDPADYELETTGLGPFDGPAAVVEWISDRLRADMGTFD